MAGGRGRGRGQFNFNIEAIGFSRGEVLPETGCQPLPLFPPTEFKPVPLNTGEDVNYILALKQELRGASKKLPYYIESVIVKKDWRRLPRELKPRVKKLKKPKTSMKVPLVSKMKKPKAVVNKSNEDVIQKLEVLEKKDTENKSDEETEEKEKGKSDEDEEAVDEEYNEEEVEEENDYIASYFEDGDDYGVSDDNMDEATY
ncbi:DNA-directed RNA polymerase III subunit RPC7 isoform X2 [Scyliorhinus canicula]|uniref:DNA-directed RNA polymerase III subunit RPC7 isoform X2 n=1 Tax=Scyliorhinus canicula TaxID=7830 RepID=UPI0018F58519|nr:DNA-directed RNA polymerase III subunit RPC7 isoform X2 [Scyliorhinus canicula]